MYCAGLISILRRTLRITLIVPLLIPVLVAASAATAGAFVMDSSVDGIRSQQELADDLKLDIPSGRYVLVLVSQNGVVKQIRITGPRVGTVRELLRPEPIPAKLWTMLKRLAETGGADQNDITGARFAAPARVVINGMEYESGDVVCVEQGAAPTIALDGPGKVHVSAENGAQSAALDAAGTTYWPSTLPISDNAVYRIANTDFSANVRLRVLARGALGATASLQTLSALEAKGCQRQLRTAMQTIVGVKQ
jgi:hypothetical protein